MAIHLTGTGRGTGKTATSVAMHLYHSPGFNDMIYKTTAGFKIKGFKGLPPFTTEDDAKQYLLDWILN